MRRRVVIVLYEGFQLLDLAGPADVFGMAGLCSGGAGHEVELTAVDAEAVMAHNGVTVTVPSAIGRIERPVDTLVVAGGLTAVEATRDERLVAGIERLAGDARRVASVCNGAILLAAAGLLAGKRVTTHWSFADQMRARYPDVRVDPEPIYINDGKVWTSAGVTAGMDLALALVADDLGHRVAGEVARSLVVHLHRPGGQSQFSTAMRGRTSCRVSLRDLQAYIDANPGADLSVPALARRSGMSERHFSRVFTEETGISPGKYVEQSRAEAARRLLETTDHPLRRVARESGFGSTETLYRAFRRHWKVSPGDYRRRFQLT